MRARGLEPPRASAQRVLNPSRSPIPPRPLFLGYRVERRGRYSRCAARNSASAFASERSASFDRPPGGLGSLSRLRCRRLSLGGHSFGRLRLTRSRTGLTLGVLNPSASLPSEPSSASRHRTGSSAVLTEPVRQVPRNRAGRADPSGVRHEEEARALVERGRIQRLRYPLDDGVANQASFGEHVPTEMGRAQLPASVWCCPEVGRAPAAERTLLRLAQLLAQRSSARSSPGSLDGPVVLGPRERSGSPASSPHRPSRSVRLAERRLALRFGPSVNSSSGRVVEPVELVLFLRCRVQRSGASAQPAPLNASISLRFDIFDGPASSPRRLARSELGFRQSRQIVTRAVSRGMLRVPRGRRRRLPRCRSKRLEQIGCAASSPSGARWTSLPALARRE